jgi:cytochrome c
MRVARQCVHAFGLLMWATGLAAGDDTLGARLAGADPARAEVLLVQCRACHATEPGQVSPIGPTLRDVVGRDIASVAGFAYSEALAGLDGRWGYGELDRFLADPQGVASGTKMLFPGIEDPARRADVIAYLRELTADPLPLPEATAGTAAAPAPAPAEDQFGSDWPQGEGREITGYACNLCHSLAIVKQQGLPRRRWDQLLVWMVEEQGMKPLPEDQRTLVLDYLAAHFGPDRRR